VNTPDKYGTKVIHRASQYGQMNVLKYLLDESNLVINLVDTDDATPLHYACVSDNLELVKYLVNERNMDIKEYGFKC